MCVLKYERMSVRMQTHTRTQARTFRNAQGRTRGQAKDSYSFAAMPAMEESPPTPPPPTPDCLQHHKHRHLQQHKQQREHSISRHVHKTRCKKSENTRTYINYEKHMKRSEEQAQHVVLCTCFCFVFDPLHQLIVRARAQLLESIGTAWKKTWTTCR